MCDDSLMPAGRERANRAAQMTNVGAKYLMVGAPGFEPGTPSPPDWCANRAALRSAEKNHVYAAAVQHARARIARAPTASIRDGEERYARRAKRRRAATSSE